MANQTDVPRYSLAERDRRWAIAQDLMRAEGADALRWPALSRTPPGGTCTRWCTASTPTALCGFGWGLRAYGPAQAYGELGEVPTIGGELPLAPGMTFALEPRCVINGRMVNIGGTVIAGEDDPLELRDGALSRRHHRPPAIARLAAAMAGVSRQRPGLRLGVGMLACTCPGLLADAGVLAACFGLAGLPAPWQGLLFAYAAGQLAGLVPLPGGPGGVLGALTLTGTPPAAAAAAVIVYQMTRDHAVGATGAAVAAAHARRRRRGALHPDPRHGSARTAATEDSTPKPTFE